jgi:hypothetical protein
MEGSLVAYKVFTNGSVLQASEVNDNLMNQSVIVFSNSAARTSAIPSPIEGMLTYLQDTNAYEYWDGAAWVALVSSTPEGFVHINTTSIGTSVSSISVNDVFSADYNTYKIFISTNTASAAARFGMRMRVSGSDNSSANYDWVGEELSSNAAAPAYTASPGATSATIGITGTNSSITEITLTNPFTAFNTAIMSKSGSADTSRAMSWYAAARLTVATSYTGFTILGATFTGGQIITFGVKA